MGLTNPTFDDLKTQIDWLAVGTAIASVGDSRPLSGPDLEDAKLFVWTAAKRWLPGDFAELTIDALETEVFITDIPDQRKPFHGYVDGVATVRSGYTYKNGDSYVGQRLIWDWKTTEGKFESTFGGKAWKDNQIDSWQWKLYCAATQAKLFSYRGISRASRFENGEPETKEVLISAPDSNGIDVRRYLQGAFATRHALVDSGLTVWPMARPDACNKWGRPCPFDDDCDEMKMPLVEPGDRQLSYSSIKDLILCPEKHRRKSLAPEEREESDSSNFGSAVHRGLEETYRQAKEMQG